MSPNNVCDCPFIFWCCAYLYTMCVCRDSLTATGLLKRNGMPRTMGKEIRMETKNSRERAYRNGKVAVIHSMHTAHTAAGPKFDTSTHNRERDTERINIVSLYLYVSQCRSDSYTRTRTHTDQTVWKVKQNDWKTPGIK